MTISHNNNLNQFGDTTLTKVFVGGLAWETPQDAMRDHFHKFGEILEAVIIFDKITGRSKGYGFVTFKEPESAKRACDEPAPVINGRRANCNLASIGARRPQSASTTPPPPPPPAQHGSNGPTRSTTPAPAAPAPGNHVQWYYPAATPASAYHVPPRQAVPFYGYSPSYNYMTNDINYNHQKLSYTGGSYMYPGGLGHGQGQAMVGTNTLMPVYPYYHFHQSSQTMGLGLPHFFHAPTPAAPINSVPAALLSKPTPIVPSSGTVGCR